MPVDRLDMLVGDRGGNTFAMVVGRDGLIRNNDARFGDNAILNQEISGPAVTGGFDIGFTHPPLPSRRPTYGQWNVPRLRETTRDGCRRNVLVLFQFRHQTDCTGRGRNHRQGAAGLSDGAAHIGHSDSSQSS